MKIKTLRECTREHFEMVLEKTRWDLEKTALLLQVPVVRVRQMLEEFGSACPSTSNGGVSPKEANDENRQS